MNDSNVLNILNNIYYNVDNPASFSTAKKLYNEVKFIIPDIKLEDVKNFILKQEVYTSHRKRYRNFRRNPFVSKRIDQNWQSDLIDFSRFSNANDGIKYLLTTIDILSKYAWVEGLRDKKPYSIITAYKHILKSGRKPSILTTDAGSEFINFSFKKFLKNKNIEQIITRNTETKAAVIERFNRTIEEKIIKYLYTFKTERYIDVLNKITSSYNNTIHSRTKFKPKDVDKNNEKIVFNNLYRKKINVHDSKLKIGDKVKLSKLKSIFEKGFTSAWTEEIFQIDKILNTSPFERYTVIDSKNLPLIGSFYSQELQKIPE